MKSHRQSPSDHHGIAAKARRVAEFLKDEETEAKIELARALGPRTGLVSEVRNELRWTFQGRKGWLIGMGFNFVTAAAYVTYLHFNPKFHDDIRISGLATGIDDRHDK